MKLDKKGMEKKKKIRSIFISGLDRSSFLALLIRDCGQTARQTGREIFFFLNAREDASEASHRSGIESDRTIQIRLELNTERNHNAAGSRVHSCWWK